ncbi:caspase family protein [Phormidesmis sp. 146-33]
MQAQSARGKRCRNLTIAVVIGINQYGNSIKSLQNAVNEAEAIARLLDTQHRYQVRLLRDQDAGLENLRNLLKAELPELIKANNRLLFYFAGHCS